MSRTTLLNPVRFGRDVIEQFGRYLLTTFPIADPELEAQVRARVQGTNGQGLVAKGPYVTLNRPFEPGPKIEALVRELDLGLHAALPQVFPFESLHAHQAAAVRAVAAGKHVVVATGTGSGKTESFLLPIIDHCLKLRDEGAAPGVAAVVVYPMNALADDQLRRLRPLLAGTQVSFGRYTGVTPDSGSPAAQMRESRRFSDAERQRLARGEEDDIPIPWEECWSREDIRERRPRILLTNYSQLEYLLLRDKDLDLFRGAPLRFLVLDEVHSYTGVLGSEVACLVRRLRQVARKSADALTCIGTSATVQDTGGPIDARRVTADFARRLFGVPGERIEVITERYRRAAAPGMEHRVPALPADPHGLLAEILSAAKETQLQDDIADLPSELLMLVERLCGEPAPPGSTVMERAHAALSRNRLVLELEDVFRAPALIEAALPRVRALGRKNVAEDALLSEILAYLTLGSLVQSDDEPLLRPKLHYFVQGYQGLGIVFDASGRHRIEFEAQPGGVVEGARVFPLVLCRSCGQHYALAVGEVEQAAPHQDAGFITTRTPDRFRDDSEVRLYLTDRLVGIDEEAEGELEVRALCRHCGAIGVDGATQCLEPRCGRSTGMLRAYLHRGELKTCLACGTYAKGFEEIVTQAMSSEVADVTILAQVMLASMPEAKLRKLLVFADNRQDAAFQAGWMEERSTRFRLRHLLCEILASAPTRTWSLTDLGDAMLDAAQRRGIYGDTAWSADRNRKRIRWFLLEELASTGQRRASIESLALAEVQWKALVPEDPPDFVERWSATLSLTPAELVQVLRLLADHFRRRGMLSDEYLRRQWSGTDPEIFNRVFSVPDKWRPSGLMRASVREAKWGRGWTAKNGRAAAQVLLHAALGPKGAVGPEVRDAFLAELWAAWIRAGVLVPVTLVRRWAGRYQPIPGQHGLHHFDVDRVGVRSAVRRFTCGACRRSQVIPTPSGRCPEYGCSGQLREEPRPEEHFDVVQYTRGEFVPLLAREHSAQVPKDERQKIEREFKKDAGGRYNCLVCTPTLELGVDIGKLEMALMRNVPPSPSNYAQRAGRAGRRHRIAVVMTYCRGNSHDRYFFARPEAMIAGEIRVPAFSMRNEPLIRKHVHSAALTVLREGSTDAEKVLLSWIFPDYIREWLLERDDDDGRARYLTQPRDVAKLGDLLSRHRSAVFDGVREAFQSSWPAEDLEAVGDESLEAMVAEMPGRLERHVRALFERVKAWGDELRRLRDIEDAGGQLTDDERAERTRCENARREILSASRQENYSLSYLSLDGFFPGYAMARESIRAQCADPFIELSRPAAVGLRELTPANFVYANRNIFRVRRLELRAPGIEEGRAALVHRRRVLWSPDPPRLEDVATRSSEGSRQAGAVEIDSLRLTSVEMLRKQDIDDRERQRRRVGFVVHGLALPAHAGGRHAQLGRYEIRLQRQQRLRLVNLGEPARDGSRAFLGFPTCSTCGESRSPRASAQEIAEFEADHLKRHGESTVRRHALHVDLVSDALHVGPFADTAAAENVFEGLRIGARLVLDMGASEVEGFTMADASSRWWVVAHDPMPGGSGFLPQLLEFWQVACERALEALDACASRCDRACYSCLLHFRNQQVHDVLDRHSAIMLLRELARVPDAGHAIPSCKGPTEGANSDAADSPAELDFIAICRERGFPAAPVAQLPVSLGNGDGTIADWAFPDHKVLVYIDGMSERIHGNSEQRRLDRVRRARARMLGWQIVEITAEALHDKTSLAVHLDELAVFLS